MAYKLMHIPYDDYTFCKFKIVVETFGHSTLWTNQLKSPKLLSQRIRKLYYKTLGTSVINNPLSPLYLCLNRLITAYISCQWWLLDSYNAWGDYYDKAPNYGPEDDMYIVQSNW